MVAVDPRRTSSAQWANLWLGLDVGSDVALANTVAREIIVAGLENRRFIEHATVGFEEYRRSVEPFTLERGEQLTGVPGAAIRELAHAYATAERAQICWTLGITEHHNAVDNVLALINLGLLTGHVGRYGSGLNPLRGQNNVQGGGDMGAIPNKFPGFQDVEDAALRAKFERAWGCPLLPDSGWHLSLMFEAMERGDLSTLYVIGENPAQSEADGERARRLLRGLDHLLVQDIFLTRTAQMADVVLPASATWAEAEGTVTSSERRVQRVRKALEPPGEARDDMAILCALARQLGHDWETPCAEQVWDELRSSVADAYRDELRAPGTARRNPMAVCGRAGPRQPVSARAAVARSVGGAAGAVSSGRAPAAGGRVGRAVPDPPHHRAHPRLLQHWRAERRFQLADPGRRYTRHLPGGR